MRLKRGVWAGAMVLLLASCGLDETYTGLGDGALPGDPLRPVEQNAVCEVECNCTGGSGPADVVPQPSDVTVASLTGRGYRIARLELLGPFEGLVADTLNNYFTEQIEADGLNVLFKVLSDDRETGALAFQLGAGQVAGAGYQFIDEGAELDCVLSGDLFQSSQPSLLVLPNDALAPPTLPINELSVSARVSEDGSAFSAGTLAGALTQEDGEAIKILGLPLANFLADSEIPPDLDLDDDGTMDAWLFEFSFEAAEVAIEATP
jgi:hypothetical protein